MIPSEIDDERPKLLAKRETTPTVEETEAFGHPGLASQ
jgi:hypothetical protein